MFWIVAISVCLCTAHACEYGRESGLFRNTFTSTLGTNNVEADTDTDSNPAFGQSKVVTFANPFRIFSDTDQTSVTIYDNGMMLFSSTGIPTTAYDGTSDVFGILSQAFATPLWFKQETGLEYKFTYKHLTAASMVDAGDKAIGQSKCDLQRIANIIGDCKADGYRDSLSDVKEALIVTWSITQTTTTYYFQGILAVNEASETHIIFLYNDPAGIPTGATQYSTGYISGQSVSAPTNNAGVCPYTSTTIASGSKLHTQSNCRCGGHTGGIYSFMTNKAADVCGKSKADFTAECNKDIQTDNTMNFNMACRPPRNPQDTCLELVYCRDTDSGYEVNVNLLHAPHKTNTAMKFLDQTQFAANTVSESTNPVCAQTFSLITGTTDNYKAVVTNSNPTTCDWTYTAGPPATLQFVVRVYDSTEADLERAGDVYLKATCNVLPKETIVNVDTNGVVEYNVIKASSRYVEMFISNSRYYKASVKSKIPNGDKVFLGQDLFLGVALDYGTTKPIDKVHAYGLYAYDCEASNNAAFSSTGTNRVIRLTDASTGCRAGTLQSGKAFYLSEEFKVASKDGADALGIISDTTTGTYNFVQLSGKFDAAKWLVGGNDHVYFRCKVKFCRNQDFKTSSKCW
ncbi:uncharacterized protein LOC132754082 [Ruditapes philippinarum]|uniref:uncharacterized protein LOC132754082 n=1 Tax=Ruditapes philippinarum TaxID=129788 RepID=UPI00295B9377|nr:uncharacterized protein LOC132754082 [Ruditapes philippinarum]